MGCKGSKSAEAPKSERQRQVQQRQASTTLLTKSDEPKAEMPVTQAPAPETTRKEGVEDATAKKTEESPKEAPADVITAKAEEAAETQGAPKSFPDATVTKAEEMKREEAATEDGSATGLPAPASNDETTTAPEEAPMVAEKMVAERAAEADDKSKAEVTESSVSVAAADAAVAGKQGGCFSYCTATEAQTEIVVQN